MKIKRPAYYDLDFASELEARWYVLFAEQGTKIILHPDSPEGWEKFPTQPSFLIDDIWCYALVVPQGKPPSKKVLADFKEWDGEGASGLWVLEGPPADKLYDGVRPSLYWKNIPTPEFERALAIALSIQFE